MVKTAALACLLAGCAAGPGTRPPEPPPAPAQESGQCAGLRLRLEIAEGNNFLAALGTDGYEAVDVKPYEEMIGLICGRTRK